MKMCMMLQPSAWGLTGSASKRGWQEAAAASDEVA
jgi:hypothetical protein